MIDIVSRAAEEGRARSSKRITAAHLKRAVEKETQLDFLWEITSKVADGIEASDQGDDPQEPGKSKKTRTRKRKKEGDDDS